MYQRVCVAGTFDRLHKGHEAVLRAAFLAGDRVILGLTSDAYVLHYKQHPILSYAERKRQLTGWLVKNGYAQRTTIVPIDDPYGPSVSRRDIEALIVTKENKRRGEEINRIRSSRDLSPLILLDVPMVAAEDLRSLSSTRVRNGEIDGNGRLVMPDNLRPELRKPLGRVIPEEEIPFALHRTARTYLITVGDKATKRLLDAGVDPTLAIIDLRVGRKKYIACYTALCKRTSYKGRMKALKSGPGYISKEALVAVEDWSRNPTTLAMIIDGEEDLLALPAIVWAPLGSVVYYGQPKEGLVEVVVTRKKKEQVFALLREFV
ncbi:pantetheine-phosphate adenylyltransferase [Patescibacteria group bacterium]|nr:pantetheine-phosphate adenylyltransferase [Patescibacteria group bacterium]MBU1472523.1 pantetheine-phosphate adenylyltransferase [Patescibacteria group bacterium]MBU2460104.1 pantetheine-phosphate adenylyltransferase [Patescibacteria group bacterium]MBU2544673.1 pantetheine-phosphate adenylyltransferase [Patescibacteria group bacterium]